MNPENTDSKKINQISFMLIDGFSLRKNTLVKALVNCIQMCSKSDVVEIMIVCNENEKNMIRDVLQRQFENVLMEKN